MDEPVTINNAAEAPDDGYPAGPRAPVAPSAVRSAWAVSAPDDRVPLWRLEWRHAPEGVICEVLIASGDPIFYTAWAFIGDRGEHGRVRRRLADAITDAYQLANTVAAATGRVATVAAAIAASGRRLEPSTIWRDPSEVDG